MDPQRNKERTLDAVAALNRGDVEGYLAIYAPRNPQGGGR